MFGTSSRQGRGARPTDSTTTTRDIDVLRRTPINANNFIIPSHTTIEIKDLLFQTGVVYYAKLSSVCSTWIRHRAVSSRIHPGSEFHAGLFTIEFTMFLFTFRIGIGTLTRPNIFLWEPAKSNFNSFKIVRLIPIKIKANI